MKSSCSLFLKFGLLCLSLVSFESVNAQPINVGVGEAETLDNYFQVGLFSGGEFLVKESDDTNLGDIHPRIRAFHLDVGGKFWSAALNYSVGESWHIVQLKPRFQLSLRPGDSKFEFVANAGPTGHFSFFNKDQTDSSGVSLGVGGTGAVRFYFFGDERTFISIGGDGDFLFWAYASGGVTSLGSSGTQRVSASTSGTVKAALLSTQLAFGYRF